MKSTFNYINFIVKFIRKEKNIDVQYEMITTLMHNLNTLFRELTEEPDQVDPNAGHLYNIIDIIGTTDIWVDIQTRKGKFTYEQILDMVPNYVLDKISNYLNRNFTFDDEVVV